MSLSTNITAIEQIASNAGAGQLQNNYELAANTSALATNTYQALESLNTSLSTDTITEYTANAGVTVESVLLKDGMVTPDNGIVTQLTSITTGVTLSKPAGVITTVAATTTAAGSSTFTVTNTAVTATSIVSAFIQNYAGTYATNGFPVVSVNNVTSGAFNIVISNVHATNALNGILKIGFVVSK